MTAALATPSRTYGAQELKQSYQRGLTLALVVAVAAHLAVIAGARWFASGAPASPPPVSFDEIFRRAPFEPTPPIRIEAEPGAIPGAPPKIDALKGIPRLVPDIDVTRTVLIPTRYEDSVLEYWDQYPTDSGTGAGPDPGNLRGIRGIRSVDVVIPKETVWVPHQEEPRRIGDSEDQRHGSGGQGTHVRRCLWRGPRAVYPLLYREGPRVRGGGAGRGGAVEVQAGSTEWQRGGDLVQRPSRVSTGLKFMWSLRHRRRGGDDAFRGPTTG
jgi:hypothetical protein